MTLTLAAATFRSAVPPRDEFPHEERPTGILCRACGGLRMMLKEREDGGYAGEACSWCDGDGFMTLEQFSEWQRQERIAKKT